MANQYSGNAQTSTFTPTVKQDIINSVGAALLAAGWTTVSGGTGTTAWKLQSATTPQGYAIRVLMRDNGGTCITFSLESSDGVLVGGNSTTVGGGFLNPSSGSLDFQIICSKFQAFIFAVPYVATSRTVVGFGVPYVPSWQAAVTTRAGWMQGDAVSDTDTIQRFSFRIAIQAAGTFSNTQPPQQVIWNGNLVANNSGSSGGNPAGWLEGCGLAGFASNQGSALGWDTGDRINIDPLLAWGSTGVNVIATFKGQLWDAFAIMGKIPPDLTDTVDGHNWQVFTNQATADFNVTCVTYILATS